MATSQLTGRPSFFAARTKCDAVGRRQAAQVDADAGVADEREDRHDRDRLRRRRDAGQAEPRRHFAIVRDAATAQVRIVGTQPDAIPERRRVLHRAQQHLGVDQRHVGMRERDAPRLGEFAHLGQRLALQLHGERTDWIDVRLVEQARAVLQHLDQAGFVERRIGIGRAREAGDTARDGGPHLGFECGPVLEARLAQARRDVDESGRDDEAARIDDPARIPAFRRLADRCDLAGGDVERRDAVDSRSGVDEPAVGDLDLHPIVRQFPAMMLITAIRTAMPKVTCGRMTARSPSATAESISTPRFIGPGCMTMTSGLASASLSGVRP